MKDLKTKSYDKGQSKQWFCIDAKGMRLGRLATQVAIILQGKHKANYTPHADLGDYVVVYNCDELECTSQDKIYYRHSGRIGSLKQRTIADQMSRDSEQVMILAVKRMLKRGPLGRKMLGKLKCFAKDHAHQAQNPRPLDLSTNKHIAEVVYGKED